MSDKNRTLQAVADRLGCPVDKVYSTCGTLQHQLERVASLLPESVASGDVAEAVATHIWKLDSQIHDLTRVVADLTMRAELAERERAFAEAVVDRLDSDE